MRMKQEILPILVESGLKDGAKTEIDKLTPKFPILFCFVINEFCQTEIAASHDRPGSRCTDTEVCTTTAGPEPSSFKSTFDH